MDDLNAGIVLINACKSQINNDFFDLFSGVFDQDVDLFELLLQAVSIIGVAGKGTGTYHQVALMGDSEAGFDAKFIGASGFAFAVALGEFGATSFLARPDHPTLPVVIYRLIGLPGGDNFGMAIAASVVLAGVTVAVIALVERLRVGTVGAFS